ncbi:MAG: sulfatase [Candidatus Aminicenantes bacterium]|nr:sulfatase [Candidatus Aminicenantes bacterium]
MIRKRILLMGIVLVAMLAGLVGLWLHFRPAPCLFLRLDITSSLHDPKVVAINPLNGDMKWQGKNKRERSRVSASGGAGFALAGQRSFFFTVPWKGASGFFCYYDLRADNGQPISMDLYVLRREGEILVGGVAQPRGAGFFVQKMNVLPGDRYQLRWQGSGRVFVGRPLLYRVLPVHERKTIVMLAADTLRGDQIDARVGDVAVAPFLASLGKESARFERCLSPSTWTLPSFASLFTARHEITHGLNSPGILDADQPFLVEAISDSFITINFNGGCWMQFQSGFQRGFDIVREGGYFGERRTVSAKSLLEGALDLLETAEFPVTFLFLHTFQVHTPYAPPADLLRRLDPTHPALASGIFPVEPPAMTASLSEKEHYFRLYQAGVSVFDRETSRFFSGLKRTGLYAQTMFILFGDHGEAFGEHGTWEHGSSLFEEQTHVPLLIRFPAGQFAGKKVVMPVSLLDVFPTLLDWLKIPAPNVPLDGSSLMPILESGATRPLPVVSSLMNCWFDPAIPPILALTYPRYKIVVTFAAPKSGKDDIKAYDRQEDPREMQPLSAQPPAEWQQSLPIIRKFRAYLNQPQYKQRKLQGKDLDPELREQLKALGYL